MLIAFYIMAAMVVVSALAVVAMRNPLHSALCLVVNLLTVAALFASLDAHFLATVQIIVYAGAIVVLVLFVLMLLNLKVERPKRMGTPLIVGATLCGLIFLAVLMPLLNDAFKVFPEPSRGVEGTVSNVGKVLYNTYVFPFEAASILIMAALVGAVMLAKRRGTFKN